MERLTWWIDENKAIPRVDLKNVDMRNVRHSWQDMRTLALLRSRFDRSTACTQKNAGRWPSCSSGITR